MKRLFILITCLFWSQLTMAESLPKAINCYQTSTNSKNVDIYLSCFEGNAEILDVNRTIKGKPAIRRWANREVMPHGETFKHRKILEQRKGYAKTEVKWLSWVVHYYYWWNEDGIITRMSLQYAD